MRIFVSFKTKAYFFKVVFHKIDLLIETRKDNEGR